MRKLLMLAAMALAATALTLISATTASANWWTLHESDSYDAPCPEVSIDDNVVTGGCLIEDFEGSFQLYANMPAPTVIDNYESTFDLIVDSTGHGYAVNQTVNGQFLPRHPCDETDGTVLPWEVWTGLGSGGLYTIGMAMQVCLRGGSTPGAGNTTQMIGLNVDPWDDGTLLDQFQPSANIRYGEWESPNKVWYEYTP